MGGQIRSFPDKTRLKEYTSTKSARDAKETALRREIERVRDGET